MNTYKYINEMLTFDTISLLPIAGNKLKKYYIERINGTEINPTNITMTNIVLNGNLALLKFIGIIPTKIPYLRSMAYKGYFDMLKWCKPKKYDLLYKISIAAILGRNLHILKWLFTVDARTYNLLHLDHAMKTSDLETFLYVADIYSVDPSYYLTNPMYVKYLNIEMLTWLCDKYPRKITCMYVDELIKYSHTKLAKKYISHISRDTIAEVILTGDLEFAIYLNRRFISTNVCINELLKRGDGDNIKFAMTHFVTVYEQIYLDCARLELLKWVVNNNIGKPTVAAIKYMIDRNDHRAIEYMYLNHRHLVDLNYIAVRSAEISRKLVKVHLPNCPTFYDAVLNDDKFMVFYHYNATNEPRLDLLKMAALWGHSYIVAQLHLRRTPECTIEEYMKHTELWEYVASGQIRF